MNKYLKKFLIISGIILISYILIILTDYTVPIMAKFIRSVLKILSPFIAGFIFAYLLVNLVDFLEKKGVKRILAVAIVFLGFFAILIYAVVSFIPIMIEQIGEFIAMAPELFTKLDNMLVKFYNKFDFLPEQYRFSIADIGDYLLKNVNFSPNFNLSGLFDVVSVIFLTPVATFYFLLEYHHIKESIKKYLKRRKLVYVHRYLHELDKGMGSYIKGLLIIVHVLVIVSTIVFIIADLKYALLFGFLVGYLDVIPYIGPYIGGAPAVLFAFTSSPQTGIIVILTLVGLQILESNVLTPYIQGKTIKIAPLYILLAVTVFGKLFGIFGMILAIPLLYFILLTYRYIRVYLRLKRIKKVGAT